MPSTLVLINSFEGLFSGIRRFFFHFPFFAEHSLVDGGSYIFAVRMHSIHEHIYSIILLPFEFEVNIYYGKYSEACEFATHRLCYLQNRRLGRSCVRSIACCKNFRRREMLSLSTRRVHIECVNLPKNVIALTSLAVAAVADDAFARLGYTASGWARRIASYRDASVWTSPIESNVKTVNGMEQKTLQKKKKRSRKWNKAEEMKKKPRWKRRK